MNSYISLEGLADRVIIKKDTPAEASAGGIIIPEVAREKPMTGTVVSVGKGRISSLGYRIPVEVEVGKKAVFHKYSGITLTIEGQEFYAIAERDVHMTFDPPSEQAPIEDMAHFLTGD